MLGYNPVMDMGFNHDGWPLSQAPGDESTAIFGRLDWHGLRARFLAAQACRQVLAEAGSVVGPAIDACFDRSAAQALARFEQDEHGVNLEGSVDGKAHSALRKTSPAHQSPVIEGEYD